MVGPGRKYFNPANPRDFVERLEKADDLDKDVGPVLPTQN
jgi:hypothetical protein